MKTRKNKAAFILKILLLAMLSLQVQAPVLAQKGTQYIFRTSNAQGTITALGSIVVPAYVLIDKVRHDGLYIMNKPGTDLGRRMKLAPGQVLLTLDGYGMKTAASADSWLARRGGKPLNYTTAVMQGKKPFILSGTVEASSMASSVASTATAAGDGTQYASNELAGYLVSMINQSRKSEGAGAVGHDATLSRYAQSYSDYMNQHAEAYAPTVARSPHTDLEGRGPTERTKAFGLSGTILENIGRATRGPYIGDKAIVKDLHDMMMAEPKGQVNHRSTIVDPKCRAVGIGITRSSGMFYLTEEFSY